MRRRRVSLVLTGLILVLLADVACASIFSPFSGFADLSLLNTEVMGHDQDNFRQEYSLNFNKRMTRWTSLRASLRYHKFDQEIEQVLGTYREEIQPSGEFRWDHPLMHFSARGLKRRVVDTGNQGIVTSNYQTSVQSRNENWPILSLRYDYQKTHSEDDLLAKDITNRRFLASADYTTGPHKLYYSFDHGTSENLISDLASTTKRHTLRWQGIGTPKATGEIQISGNYQFSYRQQEDEVSGAGSILEFVTPLEGLYAFNENPGFGALHNQHGLIDGNISAPVQPVIDIGGSGTGHNLGGNFGGTESLESIYVYTDRPSGSQVIWELYGSSDNLTWTRVSGILSQSFNTNVNRYEMIFNPSRYQYFKIVNTGFNEIAQVNITEIRFLRSRLFDGTDSSQVVYTSSHIIDGRAGMVINDLWDTALDLSFSADENHGRGGDRNRTSLGWRLNYEPTAHFAHNFNLSGFRQAQDNSDGDMLETSAGYAMMYRPSQVISGSFSLANRLSWQGGTKEVGVQSASVQSYATVLPSLSVSLGSVVSRNQDFPNDKELRSWSLRSGAEAGLLDNLDLNMDAFFQESNEPGKGLVSSRLTLGTGLSWRVSQKIFFRGALRQSRDLSKRLTVDFLASWNILNNLRLSVQHYELTDDSITTTLRRSINANWDIGSSARYYARLGEVDLSGSGGTAVLSFQQGIRISF